MELTKVTASSRSGRGKGASRRLRAEGQIPAVAYGGGQEARSLAVSPHELVHVLHSERGRNTVIELDVDGKEKLTVLIEEYQYHPVSRALLHADFRAISLSEPVLVEVPFELTGRAHGVVMGGTLRQVFRQLPVRCLPEKIPARITHDITALDMDEHLHVKDLSLPEGVEVMLNAKRTLAAIFAEKRRGGEGEEEAAAAEGGEKKAEAPEKK